MFPYYLNIRKILIFKKDILILTQLLLRKNQK
jgi:hypothetical protein